MAIVVVLNNKHQSRAGLAGIINYVANDRKTLLQSSEKLVSGINCSPHSAYDEFMLTKHLHNHIIVNSISFESGKKLHQDKKSLENIRIVSDKICSEYGLSVINGVSYNRDVSGFNNINYGIGKRVFSLVKSVSWISKKKGYDEDELGGMNMQ